LRFSTEERVELGVEGYFPSAVLSMVSDFREKILREKERPI